MRPRTILLTGAPGSGKTTLGRKLATNLRTPFLARDEVRGGMLLTNGAWGDELREIPTAEDALDLFLRLLETMLGSGASCVAEYVVRRDQQWVVDRLLHHGDCRVVTTHCQGSMARYIDRSSHDPLLSTRAVLDATGHRSAEDFALDSIARMEAVEREMMRDFSVPDLSVDTTDGYDPDVDEILRFATG